MKRILSGMRPTGRLHLGHLVGALKNWVDLQEKHECFFMIADWHALMSEYENPANIKDYVADCLIDWISCGIDPKKSTIFIQSHVKEHLELYAALSIITPLSWLERNPTYKEQLRELKGRDLTTYGFLGYPVLQAADIVLYKANLVPIGIDQLPHLELAREIIRRFKHLYKKDVFPEPEPLLTQTPKLLGIDGRKMSKSYDNYIALSDSEDEIRKKVASMFTDPKRIRIKDPGHPDECNVYSYFKLFRPDMVKEAYDYCTNATQGEPRGCTDCKAKLAGGIIDYLSDIRKRRKELEKDRGRVAEILNEGSKKAQGVASSTMKEVKGLLGMAYDL